MPHTVRRRTCPASPAVRPQDVANDGAVKHGRSAPSSAASEAGRVRPGSIGGSPQHEADTHTADASAFTPPRHPGPAQPFPLSKNKFDTIVSRHLKSAKHQCVSGLRNCNDAGQKHAASLETRELFSKR